MGVFGIFNKKKEEPLNPLTDAMRQYMEEQRLNPGEYGYRKMPYPNVFATNSYEIRLSRRPDEIVFILDEDRIGTLRPAKIN